MTSTFIWRGLLSVVIVLATLFGNILCLRVLLQNRHRKLNRPLYIFILNICIADIAVVASSMVFKTIDEIKRDWFFGHVLCVIVEYSQRALFRVNVYTHVLIACERYCGVVHALRPHVQITKLMAKRLLLCVWIFSFIVSIPLLFSFEVYGKDVRVCRLIHLKWDWFDKLYSILDLNIFFILPLFLLLFLYGSIITTLNGRKRQTRDLGSVNAAHNTVRAAIRGVRVSIVVLLTFAVCWVPVIVKGVYRLVHVDVNTDRTDPLYATAMYLAFLNNALVPLLYCALDSNLAPSVRRIFNCSNGTQNEDTSDDHVSMNEGVGT